METFSALLALEGNPPITGGFLSQRPVKRSFGFFLDLRLNKWLSKKSSRRWFETPSTLWCHSNGVSQGVLPHHSTCWWPRVIRCQDFGRHTDDRVWIPYIHFKGAIFEHIYKKNVTLEAELTRMPSECEFLGNFSKFELYSETSDHILTAFQIFVTIIRTVPNVLHNLKARSTGLCGIPNIPSILTAFETCWSLWRYSQSGITFSNAVITFRMHLKQTIIHLECTSIRQLVAFKQQLNHNRTAFDTLTVFESHS